MPFSLAHLVRKLKQSKKAAKPSKFLQLPVNVRIKIYQYLIPNLSVTWSATSQQQRPFRDDGRSCCPAMLRTNRLIYKELYHEWCSSVFYRLLISNGHLILIGKDYDLYNPLPTTLLSARSLYIFMTTEKADKGRNLVILMSIIDSLQQREQKSRIQISFKPPWPVEHYSKRDQLSATSDEHLNEYLQLLRRH